MGKSVRLLLLASAVAMLQVSVTAGLLSASPASAAEQAGVSSPSKLRVKTAALDKSKVSLANKQVQVSPFTSSYSYRHDWGNFNGDWKLNLTSSDFDKNTRAFVAIGECDPSGGKFIGSAKYTLFNVAPNAGVISIWINVNWGSPIRVCADYFIVHP